MIGANRALHMETYVSSIIAADKFTIETLLYNTYLLLFTVLILYCWQCRRSTLQRG